MSSKYHFGIAVRVALARSSPRVTVTELANRIGVSRQMLHRYMNHPDMGAHKEADVIKALGIKQKDLRAMGK